MFILFKRSNSRLHTWVHIQKYVGILSFEYLAIINVSPPCYTLTIVYFMTDFNNVYRNGKLAKNN